MYKITFSSCIANKIDVHNMWLQYNLAAPIHIFSKERTKLVGNQMDVEFYICWSRLLFMFLFDEWEHNPKRIQFALSNLSATSTQMLR